jgi:hypothetical protein
MLRYGPILAFEAFQEGLPSAFMLPIMRYPVDVIRVEIWIVLFDEMIYDGLSDSR